MTEHLVTSKRDRLKHITTLCEMLENFGAAGAGHEEEGEMSKAELWWRRENAIRWALMYVQWRINLQTGEIRAVNPEPAEVE